LIREKRLARIDDAVIATSAPKERALYYFCDSEPRCSQTEASVRQIGNPQLKNIRQVLTKLNTFVEELAVEHVKNAIIEFRNLFIDSWLNTTTHTEFFNTLRFTTQKTKQAKRRLGSLSEREEISYYLGILAGVEYAFQELYTAEERELQIVMLASSQSEKTDRILMCLYTKNGGQGLRHGELAKELNVSESSLTNTMKRILQSRAVSAVRTGKNTFYTLTPAGKRYCSKKQAPLTQNPSKELLMALVKSAFERPEAVNAILNMQRTDYSLNIKKNSFAIQEIKPSRKIFVQVMYENILPTDDKRRDLPGIPDTSAEWKNALREGAQDLQINQLEMVGETV